MATGCSTVSPKENGKGVIRREGIDITIIATLLMMHKACQAAEVLAEEGISVEDIDPRSLVPFDWEMVRNSIQKTGRVIIIEESSRTCGIGAEIAATEKFYVPDTEKIIHTAKELIKMSS